MSVGFMEILSANI